MKRCPTCRRAQMAETEHAEYPYMECGVPVLLRGGVKTYSCPACGEELLSIPAIAKLHRMVALAIAAKRMRLAGPEIKFLRKHLGYSNEDFARVMGVEPATSSRWANGTRPMNAQADRLLRLLVWRGEQVQDYGDEMLIGIDESRADPVHLELWHMDGWQPEAA